MSEPTVAYFNNCSFDCLKKNVAHLEMQVRYDIDNYGMDMSPELKEALKVLEKASKVVLKRMEMEKCIK